ncbi:MAG: hypothetical protein J6E31_10185 [Pyramidobacter sp.]|nr:hypothetical protein [Schwartzia sp. (in: firmicutes)]MBP3837450.1 hypothetical protein [Pyramidobacter sp.]
MKTIKRLVPVFIVMGAFLGIFGGGNKSANAAKIDMTHLGKYGLLNLYRDDETGVEYFVVNSSGITPRYTADGKIYVDREFLRGRKSSTVKAPAGKGKK